MPTQELDRSDAVLARQTLAGNQEAFAQLVHRYNAPLYNFVCHRLGDYNTAFDIVQHVFLQFYINLSKLEASTSFRPWLFTVAQNCCTDELRRKHRQVIYFSQLEIEDSDGDFYDIPDPGRSLDEIVEQRMKRQMILQAIESLPPKHRMIVLLRYDKQWSFSEIGNYLHIPESTAKTYFHRAKQRLRKQTSPY